MSLKVFLAGLLGGALVSALLLYPACIYLPGRLLPDWYAALPGLALGLALAAALALVASGMLAARWSRLQSRAGTATAGMAAGLFASLAAYSTVIGPAAGVWGSRALLAHGLVPAADEYLLVEVVADSTSGILWWGALSLALAAGAGLLLGALGGALVKAGRPDRGGSWPAVSVMVCAAALLASALALVVTLAVFSLLPQTVADAAQRTGRGLEHSPFAAALVLYALNYAWMLAWQALLWLNLRAARVAQGDLSLTRVLASFMAWIVPGLLLFAAPRVLDRGYVVVGAAASFALGLLTFVDTFWRQRARPLRRPADPLEGHARFYQAGLVVSGAMALTVVLSGMNIALDMVMLLIPAITQIMPDAPAPSPLSFHELIFEMFRTNAAAFAISLAGLCLYAVITLWALKNLLEFLVAYGPEILGRVRERRPRA